MQKSIFLLGLGALLSAACGGNVSIETASAAASGAGGSTGSGGSGGSSGSTGTGVIDPGQPWNHALTGSLAPKPLALAADDAAWLLGGDAIDDPSPPFVKWLGGHVWKLDANGGIIIDEVLDADGFDVTPKAIHVDNAGNAILLGQAFREPGASPSMNIGGQAVAFPFMKNAFIAKLDANGNLLWARVLDADAGIDSIGNKSELRLTDVGTDDAGRIHIAAFLDGTADLGAGPVTSKDVVVFLLSPNGDHLVDRVSPTKDTVFLQLAVEPSGDSLLARTPFYYDSHVEKFDSMGNLKLDFKWPACWVDTFAFAQDDQNGFFLVRAEDAAEQCTPFAMQHVAPTGTTDWLVEGYYALHPTLARGASGHAWLAMGLEGTIDFSGGKLTGNTVDDILIAEIDKQQNVLQSALFGGPGKDEVIAIQLDSKGGRIVAGQFEQTIDFGNGPLQNNSGMKHAIFLSRISP